MLYSTCQKEKQVFMGDAKFPGPTLYNQNQHKVGPEKWKQVG